MKVISGQTLVNCACLELLGGWDGLRVQRYSHLVCVTYHQSMFRVEQIDACDLAKEQYEADEKDIRNAQH